ncbi:MAG: hypothetical protein JWQ74_382 [Marmoricola sp.]|nr:hypothetical protein [Marmoricola sp.]
MSGGSTPTRIRLGYIVLVLASVTLAVVLVNQLSDWLDQAVASTPPDQRPPGWFTAGLYVVCFGVPTLLATAFAVAASKPIFPRTEPTAELLTLSVRAAAAGRGLGDALVDVGMEQVATTVRNLDQERVHCTNCGTPHQLVPGEAVACTTCSSVVQRS